LTGDLVEQKWRLSFLFQPSKMPPRFQLLFALLPLWFVVLEGLGWLVAKADNRSYSLVDHTGWLDARTPGAKRYRKMAFVWILAGALLLILSICC
jgi:hypothetical protein